MWTIMNNVRDLRTERCVAFSWIGIKSTRIDFWTNARLRSNEASSSLLHGTYMAPYKFCALALLSLLKGSRVTKPSRGFLMITIIERPRRLVWVRRVVYETRIRYIDWSWSSKPWFLCSSPFVPPSFLHLPILLYQRLIYDSSRIKRSTLNSIMQLVVGNYKTEVEKKAFFPLPQC